MKLLITVLVLTTPLVLSLHNKRASWNESREDDLREPGFVAESFIGKDMESTNADLTIPLPDSQLRAQASSATQNQFSYFNSQPQFNYQNQVVKNNGYQYPKPSIPFEAMTKPNSNTTITTPYPQSVTSGAHFGNLKMPTAPPRHIYPEITTTSSVPPTPDVPPSTNRLNAATSMTTATPYPQQGLAVLFLDLATPTTTPQSVRGGAYFGSLKMPTRPSRPISPDSTAPRSGPIPLELESIVDLIRMKLPDRPLYMVKGYFVPYLPSKRFVDDGQT